MTSVEILRHQLGASAYEELTFLEIGSILGLSGVWVTLSGVCFVSLNRGLSVFIHLKHPKPLERYHPNDPLDYRKHCRRLLVCIASACTIIYGISLLYRV